MYPFILLTWTFIYKKKTKKNKKKKIIIHGWFGKCTYKLFVTNLSGNHANRAGSAICIMIVEILASYNEVKVTLFQRHTVGLFSVNFMNSAPSEMSSDLVWACFRNICYALSQIKQRKVFSGQMFEVEAVAIGGQNGTTSDTTASTTIPKHNCTISGGSKGRVEEGMPII